MKAAFYTLGCKVNQYESQAMAEALAQVGYEIVDASQEADIYIVNSCTVTGESERKTRQAVRRFKAHNPGAVVVLTGCEPQAFPAACEALTQADIVLGNKQNHLLADKIDEFLKTGCRVLASQPHMSGEGFCASCITGMRERTRAYVKIEDGCNRFCSYCIIPYARGRVRSKSLESLGEELALLDKNGYKEVVLVGINLSAYGTDCSLSITDAVRLACSFDGISRVRLGSLEPDHITDEIIRELASLDKFCPQFHISLQSGSSSVLKRMNRHYTAEDYSRLCSKLRSAFAYASVTTDIMVGFPGESDGEFTETLDFIEKIGFEKVHIFPYSRREGTPAARMENQIPNAIKEKRAAEAAEKANEIRQKYLHRQIGRILEVLPEEYSKGLSHGYTANYTPVIIDGDVQCGDLVNVRITGVEGDSCTGSPE